MPRRGVCARSGENLTVECRDLLADGVPYDEQRLDSRGKWSGNGRRAGFCASTALSPTPAASGEAIASRSAWSVSRASIASSSCSASRASFSDERPNSGRR